MALGYTSSINQMLGEPGFLLQSLFLETSWVPQLPSVLLYQLAPSSHGMGSEALSSFCCR